MSLQHSLSRRLPNLARQLAQSPLGQQAGWVAAPFAVQQVFRFGTAIALAWLLAPEVLGLMMLINTLRAGVELLSDIGIGQSVVRSPHAEERSFLNTAWTLQVLRGLLLTLATIAAAVPLGWIYPHEDVTLLVLAVSPVFLVTGLVSPGLFLMQRNLDLRGRAIYDTLCAVMLAAVTIGLVLIIPSVWGLVWGLLISITAQTALSFAIGPKMQLRLEWNSAHTREILHFGKWIFLATAIYFAAISFDRIYFVAALPLAMAGVYNIARNFADILGQLGQKLGSFIVFPKFVTLSEQGAAAAPGLRRKRFQVLALMALGMSAAIACFDEVILFCLDSRYHAGAFMVPLLLASVWFNVLSSFADAMLMGGGRPAPGAWANAVKFLMLLVGLPLAVAHGSLFEALLVLIAAEAGRWVVLGIEVHKMGFAKVRDDVALTALMIVAALAIKLALGSLGLVPTIAEWWALGQGIHG